MTPQRRYVKVQMIGYLPCDLAHQAHWLMKEEDVNTIGETLKGEYYLGEYDKLWKGDGSDE